MELHGLCWSTCNARPTRCGRNIKVKAYTVYEHAREGYRRASLIAADVGMSKVPVNAAGNCTACEVPLPVGDLRAHSEQCWWRRAREWAIRYEGDLYVRGSNVRPTAPA